MRLIDADVLKELIQKDIDWGLRCGDNVIDSGYPKAMNHVMSDLIDRCPVMDLERTIDEAFSNGYRAGTLDAEHDRPTGEWYYNYQNGWHCSICHESVKNMPTVMGRACFAYCPNCGAKMQGTADDEKTDSGLLEDE